MPKSEMVDTAQSYKSEKTAFLFYLNKLLKCSHFMFDQFSCFHKQIPWYIKSMTLGSSGIVSSVYLSSLNCVLRKLLQLSQCWIQNDASMLINMMSYESGSSSDIILKQCSTLVIIVNRSIICINSSGCRSTTRCSALVPVDFVTDGFFFQKAKWRRFMRCKSYFEMIFFFRTALKCTLASDGHFLDVGTSEWRFDAEPYLWPAIMKKSAPGDPTSNPTLNHTLTKCSGSEM